MHIRGRRSPVLQFTGSGRGQRCLSRKHGHNFCRFTFSQFAQSGANQTQSQTQHQHKVQKQNAPARTTRSGFAFRNRESASRINVPLPFTVEFPRLCFEGSCFAYRSLLFADSRQTVVCKFTPMTSSARYFGRTDVSTDVKLQPRLVRLFFKKVYFCVCFCHLAHLQTTCRATKSFSKTAFKVRWTQPSYCVAVKNIISYAVLSQLNIYAWPLWLDTGNTQFPDWPQLVF